MLSKKNYFHSNAFACGIIRNCCFSHWRPTSKDAAHEKGFIDRATSAIFYRISADRHSLIFGTMKRREISKAPIIIIKHFVRNSLMHVRLHILNASGKQESDKKEQEEIETVSPMIAFGSSSFLCIQCKVEFKVIKLFL